MKNLTCKKLVYIGRFRDLKSDAHEGSSSFTFLGKNFTNPVKQRDIR